jgi:GNAT superfamily N-acetyltransferase
MTLPATARAARAATAAEPPLHAGSAFRPEAPGRNATDRSRLAPAAQTRAEVAATVRSWTVRSPVIRIADSADGPAIAALRQTWTAEDHGDVADPGFEARFLDWYERESARRISWLAEISGHPVGMMNLALFERMPRPGHETGTWGYLANAFVLAPYRNQGIGAELLAALLAYADDHGFIRVLLRPAERAIPFYQRAGFTADGGFLIRYAPRS